MKAFDLPARMKRTVRAVAAADAFALPMRGLGPDQIRRDLGGVEEAYQEIMKRVLGK